MVLHPIICELTRLGVLVEMSQDEKGYLFNLNTGAKSHLHARMTKGGTLALYMRYDEQREIETWDELCEAFDACIGTGGSCNWYWADAMRKCGHWD